jgi:hypothetical protein
MLTGRQIDRYSRQIITHGFGGAAQERLLASHLLATGHLSGLEPMLPYLVGAGIGHIALDTDCAPTVIAALQARFADLNSDIQVVTADQYSGKYDLLLGFASGESVADRFRDIAEKHAHSSLICGRLDAAPSITIIPSRPPCLTCADADLNASLGGRCASPAVVAMFAAIEAIKLLAGVAPRDARLIEFNGYATTSRLLRHRADAGACGCSFGNA